MIHRGTCWSDESRGVLTCQPEPVEVNRDGMAYLGCGRCKRLIGDAVGPATRSCVPYADGWRTIPRDWMQ